MTEHQPAFSYLVGIGVTHSIAPPMHDYVARSLGHAWKFEARECPSLDDAMALFRAPTFAGGVVTMPYKIAVMERLDGIDTTAKLIGACNNVYRTANDELHGTNTDWRGVKGCLESGTKSGTGREGEGKPALLVGAGGAARAAVYALYHELNCRPIFVANRDEGEVDTLIMDTKIYGQDCQIIYVNSTEMVTSLTQEHGYPFFVVGTVPDFEPQSESEIAVRGILQHCFANAPDKGVLLDMCFKPRRTRTIKLAQEYDWTTVEGVDVIGHQIGEQYRLWGGGQEKTPITSEIQEGAWKALRKAADESKIINV